MNAHRADAYADTADLFPARQIELLSYSEMLIVASLLVNYTTAFEGFGRTCSDAFVTIHAEISLQPLVRREASVCDDRDQAHSSAVFRREEEAVLAEHPEPCQLANMSVR